ncbi:hypothetical protein BSKO_08009 [Bryopsis sp. KO-2023]|nr:hypothetical protein BSKO_08009 [Bryopsis sp. KO-2023]
MAGAASSFAIPHLAPGGGRRASSVANRRLHVAPHASRDVRIVSGGFPCRSGVQKEKKRKQSAAFCAASNAADYCRESEEERGPIAALKTNWPWVVLSIGLVFLLSLPVPAGMEARGMRLLAIFIATIAGIVAQPIPVGAVAVVGLTATLITRTLTFGEAFAAFSAQVPWLIAFAMFLAQAIRKSGLGQRIAYVFISAFGGSPLGLAYSLVFSEFLLSPIIPSVAARAGGIVLPLVKSLSEACGSRAGDGTEGKLGSYLHTTVFHTAAVSSAMFLTANHPNPLSAKLAEAATNMPVTWLLWAKAAIIPGLCSLVILPITIWFANPPTVAETSSAQRVAKDRLSDMGPMTSEEGTTILAMLATMTLWIGERWFQYNSVTAALVGVSALLVTRVLSWDECLSNKNAWNTMAWFAILIGMATQLRNLGVIGVFSDWVAGGVGSLGLSWQPSFIILVLVYFYSHYFFASNIAHVSAMYAAFLSVAIATGAPPMFAALVFAFFSNMMGTLTQYGMSHAPMYFGEGYVSLRKWLTVGFLVSVVNIVVWILVGSVWWRMLGLW